MGVLGVLGGSFGSFTLSFETFEFFLEILGVMRLFVGIWRGEGSETFCWSFGVFESFGDFLYTLLFTMEIISPVKIKAVYNL